MAKTDCISVIGINFYPYVMFLGPNYSLPIIGVMYDMLKTASKKLNFCYNISYSVTNDLAIKLDNGSFSGALGQVERGEKEFLLSPLGITYERENAVDFSTFIDILSHSASYKYPSVTPELLGFVRPFSWKGWLCILGTTSILLLFFASFHFTKIVNLEESKISVVEDFFKTFVPLLVQTVQRVNGVTEVILGIWLMAVLILEIIYKSNLKAMLTAPRIVVPFETFEEMLTQRVLPVFFHPNSVLHEELQKAPPDSPLGRLNKIAKPNYRHPDVSLEMIKKFQLTQLTGTTLLKGLMHLEFAKFGECKLTLMKEDFLKLYIGVPFKKNSTLKNRFNKIIVGYRESGILELLKYKLMSNASQCLKGKGSGVPKNRKLSIKDFYGLFSLYLSGMTLALGVFLFELRSRRTTLTNNS